VPSAGLPSSRQTKLLHRAQRRMQRWWGPGAPPDGERLRAPGLFSCRREGERDLINASKYLMGRSQVRGARLCSLVPSNRTRGDGSKLEHRKFHTNLKKNFSTLRVTKPWNKLPRELVESPSQEVLKTCPNAFLCDVLLGICFNRVWWTGGSPEVPSNPYRSVIL